MERITKSETGKWEQEQKRYRSALAQRPELFCFLWRNIKAPEELLLSHFPCKNIYMRDGGRRRADYLRVAVVCLRRGMCVLHRRLYCLPLIL